MSKKGNINPLGALEARYETGMSKAAITIIHENDAWTAPIREALERRGAVFEDWHLEQHIHVDFLENAGGVFGLHVFVNFYQA